MMIRVSIEKIVKPDNRNRCSLNDDKTIIRMSQWRNIIGDVKIKRSVQANKIWWSLKNEYNESIFNNKNCIDDNENNCMIDIKNDIIIEVNVLV